MWLTILSDQLIVVGMVSRYLTIYLIIREPLLARHNLRCTFPFSPMPIRNPRLYYKVFRPIIQNVRAGCSRVTHPFAAPSTDESVASLDLHA